MHLPLPHLGLGTWGMGGKWERDPSNVDESVDAIRLGLSLGLRIIDVAELYGQGLAEEIVGKAITGRPREQVYIISKVWKEHLAYDDVLKATEGSLERLNTPYIDLYLVHWPNEKVPLSETMHAMEHVLDEGLVRAIGVSNFSPELIEEAQATLAHSKLVANEIEYNLSARTSKQEIIPYCHAHDIDVIAYRPLAKGAFADADNATLEEIAQRYGKTKNQIALNWLISQGTIPIPKSSNPAHIRENVGALGWSLLQEDIACLTA